MTYYEARLMHPALAMILEARGDEWHYEVCLGGTKKRVDFLVIGEHVDSLMDCKWALNPTRDIAQINLYHDIYGVHSARKVIVTDSKVYKHEIIRQYTDAGVSIMRLEGEFKKERRTFPLHDVRALYPHRCHYHIPLPENRMQEIRASYKGKHGSIPVIAKDFDLPVEMVRQIIRGRYAPNIDVIHAPTPSQETSI